MTGLGNVTDTNITADPGTGPAEDVRRGWYKSMVTIRDFEEKVQELYLEGLIEGTTHLCQGQEAVSVGMIESLSANDYLTITYRGHGHALARGMLPEAAFAELLGRATGCCGGVGGSMHLTDASLGLLGSFAIVGASYPVALGAAMSARLRGEDRVAMAFCGDGAMNIGTVHETLNMAAVWQAPLVCVIENNLYGEYTPLRDATAIDDLAARADAYGMPGESVDGQDVDAVHAVARKAVARARNGNGPTLIEAKTYRYRGHSRSDPAHYRPAGELEAWQQRDPIALFGQVLEREGVLDAAGRAEIHRSVERRIERAAAAAAAAPHPALDVIRSFVYAD